MIFFYFRRRASSASGGGGKSVAAESQMSALARHYWGGASSADDKTLSSLYSPDKISSSNSPVRARTLNKSDRFFFFVKKLVFLNVLTFCNRISKTK